MQVEHVQILGGMGMGYGKVAVQSTNSEMRQDSAKVTIDCPYSIKSYTEYRFESNV